MDSGELSDLSPGSRDVKRKSDRVGKRFAARMIGTAGDEVDRSEMFFQLLREWAFRRQRNARLPSTLIHGGNEIEETSLRTTELAELIDEQNLHRRKAVASTQK